MKLSKLERIVEQQLARVELAQGKGYEKAFIFVVSSKGNPDFKSSPIYAETQSEAEEILSRTYKPPQFQIKFYKQIEVNKRA